MSRRVNLWSVVLAACFTVLFVAAGEPEKENECALVSGALKAVQELAPGSSRALLEQKFEVDGGMQFPGNSRYLFRQCPYVKIDVEFQGDGIKDRAALLPTDKIVRVSKPYLEYPSSD